MWVFVEGITEQVKQHRHNVAFNYIRGTGLFPSFLLLPVGDCTREAFNTEWISKDLDQSGDYLWLYLLVF